MPRHASLFLSVVIFAAMITGVHHNELYGPDETREAEIARETLIGGHWITPRLCDLPYMEKPPLYYDLVALAYAAAGRITPTVARSVAVLFGFLMIAGTFVFVHRWRGARAAWLAALVLVTMPRFWRYSHEILLDIAVGALCTCAIACFALADELAEDERSKILPIRLFAIFSAAAFLTKSIAGIFSIAVVIAAFCLIERRWSDFKRFLSPVPLLLFFVPIASWLVLFYREGGIGYLYEHFVNNTLGRALQTPFQLADIRYYHTDLGPDDRPWYFYLETLPEIMGPWLIALPLAVWGSMKEIWNPSSVRNKPLSTLVLLWAFLPAFLLSFSITRERTYILPSYSALAVLAGCWLDDALAKLEQEPWRGIGWLWIAFPFSFYSLACSSLQPLPFLAIAAFALAPFVVYLVILCFRKRLTEGAYLFIALLLCLFIAGFSPNITRVRLDNRNYKTFAEEAWRRAGDNELYIYRPPDTQRGVLCFFENRTVHEINRPEDLREALRRFARTYVIMRATHFAEFAGDTSFRGILYLPPRPHFEKDPDWVMTSNKPE